jgi:HEAT repeat protein
MPKIVSLWFMAQLFAHGGQYRGPGNVVTLSTSPKSNTATETAGDKSAGGTAKGKTATSGPAMPSPRPSATNSISTIMSGSRGTPIEEDLTRWDFWWEFHKDPHLRLREPRLASVGGEVDAFLARAGEPLRSASLPSKAEVTAQVLPALYEALETAADRDLITGCMVALAKIGCDLPGMRLRDIFCGQLHSHDQEIRETAALCFGIARSMARDDHELLLSLVSDDEAGRAACDKQQVDERTRSFACYALGLVLSECQDNSIRHRILSKLIPLLSPAANSGRDVTVAAIAAIAGLPVQDTAANEALREVAIAALLDFYEQDLGTGHQLVQSHCPPAIAALVKRNSKLGKRARERFCADLTQSLSLEEQKRTNHHIAQSCAIGLGAMITPWQDDTSPDAPIAKLLLRSYSEHKDKQTRYFAVVALGSAGGNAAREVLLNEMKSANRSIERPWIVLALGNLVTKRNEQARQLGTEQGADPEVAMALTSALGDVKNPNALGATAIAIGLCQDRSCCPVLSKMLAENQSRDDFAGYAATALALLGDESVRVQLRDMMPRTVHKPELLVHVATALGKLGDQGALADLLRMLQNSEGGLARLSALSMAVGQIGDRSAMKPLLLMLGNKQLTPLARAFVAVALGEVCDPRSLPWNAHYADTLNYRAAVETLTDGSAGILDIL